MNPPKPDLWHIYAGDSEALLKQWKGVSLRVLFSNGAIAQCEGSNGQFYGSVPVYNLKEVPAPAHLQTQTRSIVPASTAEPHPVVDRPPVARQPAPSRQVRGGDRTPADRETAIAQQSIF